MKVIDITQEILSCKVFPGDPAPIVHTLARMEEGSPYNLTKFEMCSHNGTHVDAPAHFVADGKTLEQLPVEVFVGDCYVARHEGNVTAEDARHMLQAAAENGATERLLIAGKAWLTEEAAAVLAEAKLLLYGNESQTVGPEDNPHPTHRILLGAGMALLEGAVLTHVQEGKYVLCCAPLNFAGNEGAPCRAVLMC